MKLFNVISTLALLTFSISPALADFLEPRDLELASTLAAPPKAGSPIDQADYAEILSLQKSRTRAECERASYEVRVNLDTFYGPRYGVLTNEEVALLNNFFWEVAGDTDQIVQRAKVLYERPRPHLGNPAVEPCVRREVTNAYPSGHAAIARIWALLLAEVHPAKAAGARLRGIELGYDRILGGAHHRTDIVAGEELADRIFDALHRNARLVATVKRMRSALTR